MKILRLVALALLAGSVLVACAGGLTGGVLGGLSTFGVGLLLLLTLGAAPVGCAEDTDPAPDDAEASSDGAPGDTSVGPCLRFAADLGPCLGAQLDPDVGAPDTGALPDPDIGPCLGALPDPDVGLGPCLGALPLEAGAPDFATDLGPDASPDIGIEPCLDFPEPLQDAGPDAHLGPCLDCDPCPDLGASLEPTVSPAERLAARRGESTERVLASGALPPDIAARLRGEEPPA